MLPRDPIAALRQVMHDFGACAVQLRHLPTSTIVDRRLNDLQEWIRRSPLTIDVAIDKGLSDIAIEDTLSWAKRDGRFPIGPGNESPAAFAPVECRTWQLAEMPILEAGLPSSPVLVLLLNSEPNIEAIELASYQRPLTIVISRHSNAAANHPTLAALQKCSWLTRLADEDTRESSLAVMLQSIGLPFSLLQGASLAKALLSLTEVLSYLIDPELRRIRSARNMIQQQLALLQQRPPATSMTDIVAELRSIYDHNGESFKRGLGERMQRFFAPYTGSLWIALEKQLMELRELQWTKEGRVETATIPAPFLANLVATMKSRIVKQCVQDIVSVKELWELLIPELELSAGKKDISITVPPHATPDPRAYESLIANHFVLQRGYQGERLQGGLMEMVMHSRQFWFMFMILFTSAGVSWTVLNDRRFAVIMMPLRIGLLLAGIVVTVRFMRADKRRFRMREIERAREWFRSEFRRILPEIQRVWQLTMTECLATESKRGISAIEMSLRGHVARQSSEQAEQRQQMQTQLQSLDLSEKRVLPLVRARESISTMLAQIIGELRQQVSSQAQVSRSSQ